MVRDIIEDVRNKLNPFWNLPDMILNKNYEDGKLLTIMCEMSDVANSQKNIITDNLDKITSICVNDKKDRKQFDKLINKMIKKTKNDVLKNNLITLQTLFNQIYQVDVQVQD